MNIESLTIVLRPRSAWEAVELGSALVRRHAGAIWKPWLLLSLPVLLLLNALAFALDAIWLAGLLMWWLKPVFERIPLYVLSRGVFGDVPAARQTLHAQLHWGAGWLLPYLSWRRLGPARSLYLPVDLLEGGVGVAARQRRGALGGPAYGVAALVTLVGLNFELALLLGAVALGLMFVPTEWLPESARLLGSLLLDQPAWVQLTLNALAWAASSVIGPFYVGAGFGLYLNRRTELEAWDIELVLRRLRARLAAGASTALLVLVVACGWPAQGWAQAPLAQSPAQPSVESSAESDTAAADGRNRRAVATPDRHRKDAATLPQVFRGPLADDASLRQAVERAYADPSVNPRRQVTRWQRRGMSDPDRELDPAPWLSAFGRAIAVAGEIGLWLLFGALVLALLVTAPRWMKWLRATAAEQRREPTGLRQTAVPTIAPLPTDIAAAVRQLWQAGEQRDALALLYRANVEAMVARTGAALPPGATEAQCLRAARKLPLAQDRDAFEQVVRMWQYAAYAQRLPGEEAFAAQLELASRRFGWAGGAAA
ncbi:MAG: DUF4129 domain-containing protein [Proteobacteria bacterium]|nr:DUF4129 domain-containing protein [Pseudomonadota bacterium]